MTALILIIATGLVALAVMTTLWLLVRLDPLQISRAKTIFFRRWSDILSSENYAETGHRLLRWLRLSLAVLAVGVVAAMVALVLFVQSRIP